MGILVLIPVIVQGYKWLKVWHSEKANPPHLPQNAVLTFKRFKEAYDSKNINKLRQVISASYKGDVYGVKSKKEFLDIQNTVFKRLPWGVHPCLTINVYGVIKDTTETFVAIIDTHSIATVLGVPTVAYDSAPIRCKVRSENGLWVISEMFVERQLIDLQQ